MEREKGWKGQTDCYETALAALLHQQKLGPLLPLLLLHLRFHLRLLLQPRLTAPAEGEEGGQRRGLRWRPALSIRSRSQQLQCSEIMLLSLPGAV